MAGFLPRGSPPSTQLGGAPGAPPGVPSSTSSLGGGKGNYRPVRTQQMVGQVPAGSGELVVKAGPSQGAIEYRITAVGVLTCLGAVSMPLIGAFLVLYDESYRYFMGTAIPWTICGIFVGVSLLLFATLHLFFRYSPPHVRNQEAMFVLAGTFTSLLGLLLVSAALPWGYTIHGTATALMRGCAQDLETAHRLSEYDTVLHTIRAQPWCSNLTSVEQCPGWKATPETEYLRYLEGSFKCAPICTGIGFSPRSISGTSGGLVLAELGGGGAGPARARLRRGGAGSAGLAPDGGPPAELQVQEEPRMTAWRELVPQVSKVRIIKSVAETQKLAVEDGNVWPANVHHMNGQVFTVVANVPPSRYEVYDPVSASKGFQNGRIFVSYKALELVPEAPPPVQHQYLFKPGFTEASAQPCFELVAQRLQVFAINFVDLLFWEGFGLICTSVLVGLFQVFAWLCRKDTKV